MSVCLMSLQSAGKTRYLLQGQKMNVLLIEHDHPFLGFQPFPQWLTLSRLQSKGMQIDKHAIVMIQFLRPTQAGVNPPYPSLAGNCAQRDTP